MRKRSRKFAEWISLSQKQIRIGTHIPAKPNHLCQQAGTDSTNAASSLQPAGCNAAQTAARFHAAAAGTSHPGCEALSMVLNRLLTLVLQERRLKQEP